MAAVILPTAAELSLYLRWRDTGIPQRLWERDLESRLLMSAACPGLVDACDWVDGLPLRQKAVGGVVQDESGFGRGMLLCGPPGTGKTTVACAALTTVKKVYGKSVYFVRWPEYLRCRQILSAARDSADLEQFYAMHDAVLSSFAVVLDDVGHEHSSGSGFGERLLDETVRGRYDGGFPTMLTTNLQSDEWAKRYDETLRSFIYQACPPVVFDGPDLRTASLAE